jgi:hypothetical protein
MLGFDRFNVLPPPCTVTRIEHYIVVTRSLPDLV